MNNFKKIKIDSHNIAIIDLGSYKIRVAICNFKKEIGKKEGGNIKLIGFAEKRQSIGDVENNKINNLENVCENIKIAIEKAEKNAGVKVNDIVINNTFFPSFLESSKINYKRKNKNDIINQDEFKEILKDIEKKAIKNQIKKIEKNFLIHKQDLDIIVNHISSIKIDNKKVNDLIGKTGEKISLYITNVYISKSSYNEILYISKYINKNLIKIIPEEFSLTKLWEKDKDIVIIDIGNNSSYIIIKNNSGNIIGSLKIEVGIETLINKIKQNYSLTRSEIIKKIDRDDFAKTEKKEFLEIYSFLIIEALKEINKDDICPNNFFIIGGGGNNNFFKNYFKKIKFENFGLKINKNIKYIIPDIKKIAKIENVEEILNKSNLNLISLIITYNFLINKPQNKIEKIAKKILEKIED